MKPEVAAAACAGSQPLPPSAHARSLHAFPEALPLAWDRFSQVTVFLRVFFTGGSIRKRPLGQVGSTSENRCKHPQKGQKPRIVSVDTERGCGRIRHLHDKNIKKNLGIENFLNLVSDIP